MAPPQRKNSGFIFPTAEEKLKEVRMLKRAQFDLKINMFADGMPKDTDFSGTKYED